MSDTGELDRFSILADVSRRLGASLDYETTLETVASMPLPYCDGWSIVDVLLDDGSIRRLAAHHPNPERQTALRALHERYPPVAGTDVGAPAVIRSGKTKVVRDVPDDMLIAFARDDEHLALLRGMGVRSFISVPMSARGAVLGAITFLVADSGRRIDDIDVAFAEDLAGRAAMAIDNAKLHREARTARAVTESAMEAAEEAGRRKSEFLATMSHEFRTPLNAILGYSQILDMGVLGPTTPAQHSHLERLQASARHLLQLVDDVLDVAKVDADRLEVRQESLITGASVVAAATLVHPQATAKGIRLLDHGSAAPGVPYIGDERRVRQILVNLLSNAVKFTPSGGEVTVNCGATREPDPGAQLPGGLLTPAPDETPDAQRNWAFIRVADSGPGISAAFMSRLFEPFVQADGALTRVKGGTGLGLAISRRLARRMGGDITARSRVGAGATFTLWLPMRETDAPATAVAPAPESTTTRNTPTGSLTSVIADGTSLDEAAYDVLFAIGTKLSSDAEVIAERYVTALREDGRFPGAHDLHNAQLRDHATPFVGLLASQLTVLGETHGQDPELLADGGHLQRLVAELHGAQRHRLGWSEADIERESKLLTAEVERAIRASVDIGTTAYATREGLGDAMHDSDSSSTVTAAIQYALDVAFRVLEQGSRTTARTFRFARSADAP
ncbi:MAG: GAF domain-containing sensor histidine kinase [Gemmatimonadaceae bacterium]|nr:GAF domain-containing sensor histidine kinase [Gemmatimonadaceae bacterium]